MSVDYMKIVFFFWFSKHKNTERILSSTCTIFQIHIKNEVIFSIDVFRYIADLFTVVIIIMTMVFEFVRENRLSIYDVFQFQSVSNLLVC